MRYFVPVFICIVIFSCSKKDTLSNVRSPKLLTYAYWYQYNLSSREPPIFKGSDTNYYNLNRLTARKTHVAGLYNPYIPCLETFQYDKNGRVVKVERKRWDYTLEAFLSFPDRAFTFEYQPSVMIIKEWQYFNQTNSPWVNSTTKLTLNKDDKPVSYIKTYSSLIDTGYYYYEGKNLAQLIVKKTFINKPEEVEVTISTFKNYDNYKNPYKGYYYIWPYFDLAWSENNYLAISRETKKYVNGVYDPMSYQFSESSGWAYEYNDLGYPALKKIPGNEVILDRYTYK